MKILIVEDEKLLADSIRLLLEKHGFEADAVYDGDTGDMYVRPVSYTHLTLPTTSFV